MQENQQATIEQYSKQLKAALPSKRYNHSIGVMETAIMLAKLYNVDKFQAAVAGLLHDAAKYIPYDQAIKMCGEYGITVDQAMINSPKIIHGTLGAAIVKDVYGVKDEAILHAIQVHTLGCEKMSVLDKIIYIADYIEPNRDFDGVEQLRMTANIDLNQAILMGIDGTMQDILARRLPIHPEAVHAWNGILEELDVK
ncbi:MAG: bis(5'-nucleosyl)-tetraphosphatase (symmetrical) YqeK [Hyphomonadaceae bacterium]|nr:bis(5'-nucleosyl)-tetraphosphatase (symmetrical) YqeK [Clostridia bacterium]